MLDHLIKEMRKLGPGWLVPQLAVRGDVMKLQIKVEDGVITDARFKTYGCGSAIASSSLITEMVKGMTLDQAGAIKNSELAEELALPPVKIHCSILAEDAIKAAVADYRSKHDR
jgi:nitrogen fixation protein NifU and related proteins